MGIGKQKKDSNTIWIYVTLLSDHILENDLCKARSELFVLFLSPCF